MAQKKPWKKDKKHAHIRINVEKTVWWDSQGKNPETRMNMHINLETNVADLIGQLDKISKEIDPEKSFVNVDITYEYGDRYIISSVDAVRPSTEEEIEKAESLLLEQVKENKKRKEEHEAKILREAERIKARKS